MYRMQGVVFSIPSLRRTEEIKPLLSVLSTEQVSSPKAELLLGMNIDMFYSKLA